MQNGYYQATGGFATQLNVLNTISNNLANTNTAGFKEDKNVIGDFERLFADTHDDLPLKNHTKEAAKHLNRGLNRVPRVVEQFTDFATGPMKATGNKLDLAITQEDMFFAVKDKNGEFRLSKTGAFIRDAQGFLADKDGNRVLSSAYFANPEADGLAINGDDLVIDIDGNLFLDGAQTARMMMVKVSDLGLLKKIGDNLYELKDLTKMRDLPSSGALKQGFLEMSNVNAIEQMSSLISTHRMVEMYQKVMTSHMEDANNDAINKLATPK